MEIETIIYMLERYRHTLLNMAESIETLIHSLKRKESPNPLDIDSPEWQDWAKKHPEYFE